MVIMLFYTMKVCIKRLEFVFDYKTPHGYLGFGYQKKELPEIIQYLSELKSNNWSPQIIHCGRTEDLKITHSHLTM